MISFIPNLAWSCRVLHITDEGIWRIIDRMIYRIHRYFNLDMLQSVVPSYYEVGRMTLEQDRLFEALESRFKEIKLECLKSGKTDQVESEESGL